ncbi:hypothetical protein D1007_31044 [Hordeum vulgare]|nr:hypothetical protein D1007_31044 [Hordeum vulgare]
MRLHVSCLTHNELDSALGALLGFDPEDLPHATPPLYACDDMEGLVEEMPVFDEWGLVGSHKGSSIAVSSSGEEDNNKDLEVTEGEEDVGRILPSNLHPSLCNLGDDIATNERH